MKDGNVITAGGVTSGIDFGLSVVAQIAGDFVAQGSNSESSRTQIRLSLWPP